MNNYMYFKPCGVPCGVMETLVSALVQEVSFLIAFCCEG